jgi:hypothetical protein
MSLIKNLLETTLVSRKAGNRSILDKYSPTSFARPVVSDSTKRPRIMSKNEQAEDASMKGEERL